jgi:hypothetical protein
MLPQTYCMGALCVSNLTTNLTNKTYVTYYKIIPLITTLEYEFNDITCWHVSSVKSIDKIRSQKAYELPKLG